MVIGKTSPYFHFPIIFPWKWPDPSFEKKKIIIQEALEPSFVDTRGGVLEKIQIWNKLICTWKDKLTDRQTLNRKSSIKVR